MTASHLALVIVGTVALAESTWGISSPDRLRDAVRSVTEEAPERSYGLAAFFAALSAIFWFLMEQDRTPADWALLFVCWIFAGGAIVNLTPNGFRNLVSALILNRSDTGIRLLYACEFLIACVLIGLGVST